MPTNGRKVVKGGLKWSHYGSQHRWVGASPQSLRSWSGPQRCAADPASWQPSPALQDAAALFQKGLQAATVEEEEAAWTAVVERYGEGSEAQGDPGAWPSGLSARYEPPVLLHTSLASKGGPGSYGGLYHRLLSQISATFLPRIVQFPNQRGGSSIHRFPDPPPPNPPNASSWPDITGHCPGSVWTSDLVARALGNRGNARSPAVLGGSASPNPQQPFHPHCGRLGKCGFHFCCFFSGF